MSHTKKSNFSFVENLGCFCPEEEVIIKLFERLPGKGAPLVGKQA